VASSRLRHEKVSIAHYSITRVHRGYVLPVVHCGPPLRAASTSLRAAFRRKAACTRARHHACLSSRRPMHAWLQCRPQSGPRDILTDYKPVPGERVQPRGLCGRLSPGPAMIDRSGGPQHLADGDSQGPRRPRCCHKIKRRCPRCAGRSVKTFVQISKSNPDALRPILTRWRCNLAPWAFSPALIGEINRRIDELDEVSPPTMGRDGASASGGVRTRNLTIIPKPLAAAGNPIHRCSTVIRSPARGIQWRVHARSWLSVLVC